MRRVLSSIALVAAGGSLVIGVAASASGETHPQHDSAAVVAAASSQSSVVSDVAAARLATAKYATNLARAKADGYRIITLMIPNMGYHFMNPGVTAFNVR